MTCFACTSSADKRTQAGDNAGCFMAEALLKTGKHTVTATTGRQPEHAAARHGGEEGWLQQAETLVEALRGQEALFITISGRAPIKETEEKLVRAAGEAGVPWMSV